MSLGELGKALAASFASIDHAAKNANNPHFKSTYADLATVLNMVREHFKRNGLSVVQSPGKLKSENGITTIELTTAIIHSSGELVSSQMDIPVAADKQGRITAHAVGSAITYGRRYALAAAAGITQADDDGNAASDGAEDDDDSGVDSLRDSLQGAKTKKELLAFKDAVSASGDQSLVDEYKALLKQCKQ